MFTKIPNLRHLRAFREVALHQSISGASRSIYLSQPAITQAIAKLETQLGISLFDRNGSGMFITAPGELFKNRVDRCLDQLKRGASDAVRLGAKPHLRRDNPVDQSLTVTQLRALITVASAGSFTLAAQMAGVSQPSLHRAARELEELFELPLFEKTSKGLALTRAAESLAQCANLAFAEIQQGFAEIDSSRGVNTGAIVIGTMPLARTALLPAVINEFTQTFPEAAVRTVDGPYDDLLRHLLHGEVDILLGALRFPEPSSAIVQEELITPSLAVVARKGHPLSARDEISTDELSRYPWVVPKEGAPTRDHFHAIFDSAGVSRPTQIVESSSLVLIRGLLLDSDRLTVISSHQVLYEWQIGHLVLLPVDLSHTRRPIGLTRRRGWEPTEMQRAFISILQSRAKAYRDL